MGFNYGRERQKFEDNWRKLRIQYRAAGLSEDQVDELYTFDNDVFREQRRYENHRQSLPSEELSDDDQGSMASLFRKFEQLSDTFDESSFSGAFAWVDTISDAKLTYRLKQLRQADLELLTLLAVNGYTQSEIARLQGCSKNAISKKVIRIKNFLK